MLRMYNQEMTEETEVLLDQADVQRWTSPAFRVQFGQIAFVEAQAEQEKTFRLSAWGLSESLCNLLSDYSNSQIQEAVGWLTMQQNSLVAEMLEQMSFEARLSGSMIPSLEQLFVAIETELYLPRGLRMPVTCITNIVPHGRPMEALDKFVAVLDMSESQVYIQERRGTGTTPQTERLH